ncbi:MAG: hypothetical protein SGI88_10880 [Candidatus Hydrogenedentes bacterium]|nr:hypothetical protein [Candidatus Hydrogenedentota bacterium]
MPRLIIAFAVLMALAPGALAFYPFGFFSAEQGGQLEFIKWPLSKFDTNGDGDVTIDEGIELNFEFSDDIDPNFFTEIEVDKVLAGFTEWELVSTAFVGFRRGQDITDPVELDASLNTIDAFNVVVFESEEDVIEQGGTLTGGSYVLDLIANSFEDTFITIGGTTIPVDGAQIIDVDTVYNAINREHEAEEPGVIKSVSVLGAGTFLGLGYSPLENIDEDASETAGRLVEDKVVAIRNFDGEIGLRGVTSSMLNAFIAYDEGGGIFVDSHQDLAPDDIAGITFLYPRADQDLFFNLAQRVRSQGSNNVASTPIGGAWIRAWCDADNAAGSNRVPMFDTLTGLYNNGIDFNFRGHFQLNGMFKQLETLDEQSFAANYVVTSSEFLPIVFPGEFRSIYDTTHGGFNGGVVGDGAIVFDTLFPSEVFNEDGNLFGLQSVDQGTPLVFDLIRRRIVSETSDRTLDTILAAGRPMFGDQNETCPLNVVIGPPVDGGGEEALTALRGVRDNLLLQTAVGAAITDVYYRIAPSAASALTQNASLLTAARWAFDGLRWVVLHAEWLLVAASALLFGALARNRTVRLRAAALTVAVSLFAFAGTANAQMLPYEISDYFAMADDVVVGKVIECESRWIENNTRIITDIAVQVDEPIKGKQNSGGSVHLQLPTGRVGAIGRSSAQMPAFAVGEEILVFLDAQKKGYMVAGGVAGKFRVVPHPKTGEKYVFATSMQGHLLFEREAAKMKQQEPADGIEVSNASGPLKIDFENRTLVKLEDFVKYLRDLDRDQQKHTLTAKQSE